MSKYSKHKIAWFQWKLNSMAEGVLTPPIYVRVKPNNRCNHKCSWCVYHEPDGMHEDMGKADQIPLPKMLEILEDFEEMGVEAVTYSGGGEPLLHPQINEILRATVMAKSVITNGQNLAGETADLLVDADWVRVSIDYWSEESFEQSRRVKGSMFNEVLENLDGFSRYKDDGCDLCVNFIITRENHEHLAEATDMLVAVGIEGIRFSPVWTSDFAAYHEPIRDKVMADLAELGPIVQSSYTPAIFEGNPYHRPYTKCFVWEFNPVIGADLNVYPCHNQAYDADSALCSIKDQRFRDAWHTIQPFNCQELCTGQCSAEAKNLFIHELMECQDDPYV